LIRLHDVQSDMAGYHTDPGHRNYKNGIPVESGSEFGQRKKSNFLRDGPKNRF